MRSALVAGNWKMHGSLAFAGAFAEGYSRTSAELEIAQPGCQVVIFPPVSYLGELHRLFSGSSVELGAQDLNAEAEGAFTGEIAAEMIRDLGARWVLVGHSERRQRFGEDDDLIARKFAAALRAGLLPILCVGETLDERDAGKAEDVVRGQLKAVIDEVGADHFGKGTIAYEPVWAIGTGRSASPEQAQAMHGSIREYVEEMSKTTDMRILYGGSVNPGNAAALFAEPDIDGGLVGGASLDPQAFAAIVAAT